MRLPSPSTERRAFGPNAIGNAIAAAHALIEANDFEGHRKVIDFSGDSAYSFGGMPIALPNPLTSARYSEVSESESSCTRT